MRNILVTGATRGIGRAITVNGGLTIIDYTLYKESKNED